MTPLLTAANNSPLNSASDQPSSPIGVIFDTDMWIDIDDMMALAMLHALQDRGELELLAVTLTTEDRWIGPYVALINTFYGHADIPIGTVRDGVTPASTIQTIKAIYPFLDFQKINYTQALAQAKTKTGQWVYPRTLASSTPLPESVSLLRKTLAARPDQSVVIIQTGYSTNMARLLDSPVDAISPLDGRALCVFRPMLNTHSD
jgi:inosine-uridine nucleoside N-ribohydrolase